MEPIMAFSTCILRPKTLTPVTASLSTTGLMFSWKTASAPLTARSFTVTLLAPPTSIEHFWIIPVSSSASDPHARSDRSLPSMEWSEQPRAISNPLL